MNNIEEIVKKINNFIKRKFFKGNFDENTNLFDTGIINSFGLIELILFCEKNYNIDISNVDFYNEINTINKLSKYIYEHSI